MQRKVIAITAIAVVMVCSGMISAVMVPANFESNSVPDYLREGRWEMGIDGLRARDLTETLCGTLPQGVWLDRPEFEALPVLLGAEPELSNCFEQKALPAMHGEWLGEEAEPEATPLLP